MTTDAPADAGTAVARPLRPIVAATGSSAVGTLAPFLTGAMALQIQRELSIGDAAFGAALSVVFATGGLGVVVAGTLVDRRGWRFGIRWAGTCGLVCTLGIAGVAQSVWMLAGFLVFGGAAMAMAGPSGSLALVEEVPASWRGTAFGIKQAAGPTMAMFAGISVPAIALTVGWRWAFVVAATVPVLTILSVPGGTAPRTVHNLAGRPAAREVLLGAVRSPSMLLYTVAAAFGMASVGAMTSFIVVSSVAHGLSEAGAGTLVTFASIVGLVARILSGWSTDRFGTGGFQVAMYLLACGGFGFLLLSVATPATTILGALLAYSGGWGWTGLMQYGAVTAHPEAPASAAAVIQAGMSVGAAAGPVGYGVLSGRLGYAHTWLFVAACTWGAALLILVGLRRVGASTWLRGH